jgi:hypothetical protein
MPSRTMHLIFALSATLLLAYVTLAAAHDIALALFRPVAPYFLFMSP